MKTKARRKSPNIEDRRVEGGAVRAYRNTRNLLQNFRYVHMGDEGASVGGLSSAKDIDRAALADKIRIDAEREKKKKSAMSKKVKR